MDPYYLQMAAELYSPEMIFDSGNGVVGGAGGPLVSPLYTSPGPPPPHGPPPRMSLDEATLLAAYGMPHDTTLVDNDILFYTGGAANGTTISNNGRGSVINEDDLGGLYADHPAFLMQQQGGGVIIGGDTTNGGVDETSLLTHRIYNPTAVPPPPNGRPPSRLNF